MSHPQEQLLNVYRSVRARTIEICSVLEFDDYLVQPEPDVSPPKWHLGHSTWFFDAFVLRRFLGSEKVSDPSYGYVFNSYYEGEGERLPRDRRSIASRPTLSEVMAYRAEVDQLIERAIEDCSDVAWCDLAALVQLGLNHEQQHQELLLTDIKAILAANVVQPSYGVPVQENVLRARKSVNQDFVAFACKDEIAEIGAHSSEAFSFDNEHPRHRCIIPAFELATRLVTNRDYINFIDDGGYTKPILWLSDGWAARMAFNWKAPRYWRNSDGNWRCYTLSGERDLDFDVPVSHVSFYEAEAFARWSDARLPTEQEWEFATSNSGDRLEDLFGSVWQWTSSPYVPYPGFKPLSGTIGEYNGKFMCNQMVLRGSSWATPPGHSRTTYRNFFPCEKRWQVTGIRLARSP